MKIDIDEILQYIYNLKNMTDEGCMISLKTEMVVYISVMLILSQSYFSSACFATVDRTVLFESFTDVTHPGWLSLASEMNILLGTYLRSEMVPISYHVTLSSGSPFSTVFGSLRKTYYGVSSTPVGYIDGRLCAGACDYRTEINADLAVGSPILMSVSGRLDFDEGFVIVETEAVDPVTSGDLYIRIAVCEDPVPWLTHDLRYVLRTMGTEENIELSAVGDTARTARNFEFDPAWDTIALNVIAFVQTDTSMEVLQAGIFDGSPALTVDPLPITNTWVSGTLPVIDGMFDPGEWTAAEETFVDLSYYVNFPFYAYTMNDDTWLYLCIDAVGDESVGGIHSGGIFFDTKEDGFLIIDEEAGIETYFGGDCAFELWDGAAFSLRSSSPGGIPFTGGLYDEDGMIGAAGYGTSDRGIDPHYIYEFRIPLALGELNAIPGDVLRPYMYVYGASEKSYWSPHTDWEDPITYGYMTLADSTPAVPVSIFILLPMVSGVLFLSVRMVSRFFHE